MLIYTHIYYVSPLMILLMIVPPLYWVFLLPKDSPQPFIVIYDCFLLSFYLLTNVFIWRWLCAIIEQGTKSRLTVFPSPLCRC